MKISRRVTMGVALVLSLILALLVYRYWGAERQAKAKADAVSATAPAASASAPAQAPLELAASDVVKAELRELSQGLAISGTVKAFNSAMVKARAVGELQGLSVREGDSVRAGQLVARIDPQDYQARVRQAEQQARAAQAQIDIAQRQWDNNKALMDQGFISKAALDNSLNNLSATRATHEAAMASVDMAKKALDDTLLRAPISGVVSQRLSQNGERVAPEARVLEIVDLSRMELEASVSASEAGAVRLGQGASLQVEGIAQPFTAQVTRVNPSAQAGNRALLIYLEIQRPVGLRQGLFAQGRLTTGQVATLAVPLSAVRTDKPNPYLQVLQDNQVRHLPVQLGQRGEYGQETWVAVTGVEPGARVLRGALGQLREGTKVSFTESTPAAAARATSAASVIKP